MDYQITNNYNCRRSILNPNHRFKIHNNMRDDDKIILDVELKNGERFVARTLHNTKNLKFCEIRKLYWCEDCGYWCNTKTKIKIPINIFKKLIK